MDLGVPGQQGLSSETLSQSIHSVRHCKEESGRLAPPASLIGPWINMTRADAQGSVVSTEGQAWVDPRRGAWTHRVRKVLGACLQGQHTGAPAGFSPVSLSRPAPACPPRLTARFLRPTAG